MTIFTPPQVAARWKCKPETVRRLLETRQLCGFTVSPAGVKRRRWRVTLDAVLNYESGDAPTEAQAPKPRRRARVAAPAGPF